MMHSMSSISIIQTFQTLFTFFHKAQCEMEKATDRKYFLYFFIGQVLKGLSEDAFSDI